MLISFLFTINIELATDYGAATERQPVTFIIFVKIRRKILHSCLDKNRSQYHIFSSIPESLSREHFDA